MYFLPLFSVYGQEVKRSVFISVKNLIDEPCSQTILYRVKALYSDLIDKEKLLFSIEDNDYIIPVQLIKTDLGAVKRFASLNLNNRDTLVVEGFLSVISVRSERFKGLSNAKICEVGKYKYDSQRDGVIHFHDNEVIPWNFVDQKPSFNSGDLFGFEKWVNKKLRYPKQAKENGIQGRVYLQFIIRADGRLTDVEVLRSSNKDLEKEALRVVSRSPKWEPGRHNGKPVDVIVIFPVIFLLV